MENGWRPFFVENRVICMTRYAIRFMPPVAVFYIMLADSAGRSVRSGRGDRLVRPELALGAGIAVVRETFQTLPPSILNWFYEVRGKLQEAGQALAPVEGESRITVH